MYDYKNPGTKLPAYAAHPKYIQHDVLIGFTGVFEISLVADKVWDIQEAVAALDKAYSDR